MKDGSERFFRIEFAKVDMPGGKLGVVCGFKDVDDDVRQEMAVQLALQEGRRAEEENRRLMSEIQSAAKLADLMGSVTSLLSNMPAMSFSKDAHTGRYLACNQPFAEYAHKAGPEAVVGLTDHEIFDRDTADHFVEDDRKALAMDRPYIYFEDVPDAGGKVNRREEFSFRTMLEQINTMVMAQCSERGLKYECSMVGGVSDYYIGDDMKLKQVLINILSNAIKFTDAPGSVTLSVERTGSFNGQSTIKFVIRDTGIGMDKAFIPKIFDSFTQEDSSRSSKYGSTGLGMAITKNIVELMNGTISVESEKGVGTAFTVIVSLQNCARQVAAARTVRPRDMRVLVVDDEEIAAEHARLVLEEVGIQADTCLGGAQALQMLEAQHARHTGYNLVLLDWKMPGMDGHIAKPVDLKLVIREIRRVKGGRT